MPKILIIDDDPDIVEAMRVVLESKNYKVFSAKDGKEGLIKIKQDKPDLIILDIMMQTMDEGFEVARKIKVDDSFKDTPILMLTAVRDKTGFDFEKEAGDKEWLPVDDYVEKPLKPEELISKVESLLKKK